MQQAEGGSSPFLISTPPASSPVPQQPLVPQVRWHTLLKATVQAQGLPWCVLFSVPWKWAQGPSRCKLSLVPWMWARVLPYHLGRAVWQGGEKARAAAAGEFPKLPQNVSFFSLFLFEKILLLSPAAPYKEGPFLSHSPPLQLDLGLSGSGPGTAQLSTLPSWHPQSPWVYPFLLIPLPATSSNQISLGDAQTLFGRGGSC